MSDDGRSAIVIIAMVGNPFSPAYARARRRGPASPLRYCSMNVAVYGERPLVGRPANPFALGERAIQPSDQHPDALVLGRSTIRRDGDKVVVDLDERTTPLGSVVRRPIRGRVTVHFEALPALELVIDAQGLHRWWPIAPLSRIEVELVEPALRFRGHGYFDANAGDLPLEATFEDWSWSRGRQHEGACLTYDVLCASGAERTHAFVVTPRGEVRPLEGTHKMPIDRTRWGLARHARVDRGARTRVVRSLEDGPFYTRALVSTRIGGRPVLAVHELLAAHRLREPWVQFCTGYRMRADR